MPASRSLKLIAIGTAAGGFSGLFGIGGGAVLVPLLVLWLGYDEREAAGTSLGAIVCIATVGVVVQGLAGNVRVGYGLVVGLPAVAGVLAGVWLQRRLSRRVISLLFACVLLATAIELVLQ